MADLKALQQAIKLVADVANAAVKAQTDTTAQAKIAEFAVVLPDLLALLPLIGDIESEVNALAPADYATLLANLATDLSIQNTKIAGIVNASIKLLGDLAVDVPVLIQAIKA